MELTIRSIFKGVSLAFLIAAALPVAFGAAPTIKVQPEATLDEIVAALSKTEQSKQNDLQSYASTRRYVLKNGHFTHDAEMMVRMDFNAQQGKHFNVVSEHGTE